MPNIIGHPFIVGNQALWLVAKTLIDNIDYKRRFFYSDNEYFPAVLAVAFEELGSTVRKFTGFDNLFILNDLAPTSDDNANCVLSHFIFPNENEMEMNKAGQFSKNSFQDFANQHPDAQFELFFDIGISVKKVGFNDDNGLMFFVLDGKGTEYVDDYLSITVIFIASKTFGRVVSFEGSFKLKDSQLIFQCSAWNDPNIGYISLEDKVYFKLFNITSFIGGTPTVFNWPNKDMQFDASTYPYPCVFEKIPGAVGYNNVRYNLLVHKKIPGDESSDNVADLLWKERNLLYNLNMPINKENFFEKPLDILAYCLDNGAYDYGSAQNGILILFNNRFRFDQCKHLLGSYVSYSFDGSDGFVLNDEGDYLYKFMLTPNSFKNNDGRSPDVNNDGPEPNYPLWKNCYFYVPKECVGTYLVMGIPYEMRLAGVGLEGGSLIGVSEGLAGTSSEISATLFYSRGGQYGSSENSKLYNLRYDSRDSKQMITVSFNAPLLIDKNNRLRSFYIIQNLQCNFAILNITQDVFVIDGSQAG